MHRNLSSIGVDHQEYEDERPMTISVKPNRRVTGATGLTITGVTSEGEVISEPLELWELEEEYYDASDINIERVFTDSIIKDVKLHLTRFPQMPYNYTPQKYEEAMVNQRKWIRQLKDILLMD